MASHVYTLYELVDLALRTPSVGAVNFNILRIILHKIISECKLQNITAEWKPFDATPVIDILDDDELPDHPILRRVEENKIRGNQLDKDQRKMDDQLDKDQKRRDAQLDKKQRAKSATPSLGTGVQTSDILQETQTKDTSDEATDSFESETQTEISDEYSVKQEKFAKIVKKKMKKKEPLMDSSSKGLKVGSELWQLWQIKKMAKTVEALEEELSELVDVVDELQEFKESRMKRTKFEEGEKYKSDYSGSVVNRHEFEDAIDALGEALVRVTIKQNQQKEHYIESNEGILKEVSQKVSLEDLTKSNEPINKKLTTLSVAVRNIQKLIKDVIYPETCGITKCMACNRKAHLPLSCLAIDARQKRANNKRTGVNKEERSNKKHDSGADSALEFTNIRLQKLRLEESQHQHDTKYPQDIQLDQQERHPDKPIFPDYLVSLDPFSDPSSISRDFAPLRVFPDLMRRNTVCVPAMYPNLAPAKISVKGDNTKIFLTRCSNPVM